VDGRVDQVLGSNESGWRNNPTVSSALHAAWCKFAIALLFPDNSCSFHCTELKN